MIQLGSTWVSVWEVDKREKFSLISMSTSRKEKGTDKYINSSWGKFNSFVGEAHGKVSELIERLEAAQVGKDNKQPVRIQITSGGVSKEPYTDKEGNLKHPEQPKFVIFNFEFDGESQANPATPPDDDDIPF